jgi:uncharacterized protein DUF6538
MRRNGVGYSCMLLRAGTYYFRKVIPDALRPILGKRELLVSLRTKDKETAKSRLHRAALEADAKLAAAKRKLAAMSPEKMAARWKDEALALDFVVRQEAPQRDADAVEVEVSMLDPASRTPWKPWPRTTCARSRRWWMSYSGPTV